MDIAERIRKVGFKRWYERQLIESHGYLVTCFLCMILVAAALGEFSFKAPGFQPMMMLVLAFIGGWLGIFAWGQYRAILNRAERIADDANCPQCRSYAKFKVIASGKEASCAGPGPGPEDSDAWMRVRCRECGHEWTIG